MPRGREEESRQVPGEGQERVSAERGEMRDVRRLLEEPARTDRVRERKRERGISGGDSGRGDSRKGTRMLSVLCLNEGV